VSTSVHSSTRILAANVETAGATVDLRRAHPDEIQQLAVETRLLNLPFKAEHGVDDALGHVYEIDSSFHDVLTLHQSRRNRNGLVTPAPGHAGVTHGFRHSSKRSTRNGGHLSHGSD
jgi:hypothetical protein